MMRMQNVVDAGIEMLTRRKAMEYVTGNFLIKYCCTS